jgi:hypothetical protein
MTGPDQPVVAAEERRIARQPVERDRRDTARSALTGAARAPEDSGGPPPEIVVNRRRFSRRRKRGSARRLLEAGHRPVFGSLSVRVDRATERERTYPQRGGSPDDRRDHAGGSRRACERFQPSAANAAKTSRRIISMNFPLICSKGH